MYVGTHFNRKDGCWGKNEKHGAREKNKKRGVKKRENCTNDRNAQYKPLKIYKSSWAYIIYKIHTSLFLILLSGCELYPCSARAPFRSTRPRRQTGWSSLLEFVYNPNARGPSPPTSQYN